MPIDCTNILHNCFDSLATLTVCNLEKNEYINALVEIKKELKPLLENKQINQFVNSIFFFIRLYFKGVETRKKVYSKIMLHLMEIEEIQGA